MAKHLLMALALVASAAPSVLAQRNKPAPPNPIQKEYQAIADRIVAAAIADSAAWNKLAELTDGFGNRLSGSDALERAIDWILARMKSEGLANAHKIGRAHV